MTDRRETPRPGRRTTPNSKPATPTPTDWSEGERIAKWLARAGGASRRECETLIESGKVSVNGRTLTSPAFKVTGGESIKVNGKRVDPPEQTRLWRYHKPSGLITTTTDPAGRRTIYDELPKHLPRTVTVGRLDLTTEGLLLLTNDGELARTLELPRNEFRRRYRARAHGRVTPDKLATLKAGAPIIAELERETGANNWISVELTEGKKREVRRALESVDLEVNRLIRTNYGPFELADLKPGAVEEVSKQELQRLLGTYLPAPGAKAKKPARAPKGDARGGLNKRRRKDKSAPKK